MATQQQIDLRALAIYALNTFDFDAEYEDDEFAITFEGVRVYVERKRDRFVITIGREAHDLPRC